MSREHRLTDGTFFCTEEEWAEWERDREARNVAYQRRRAHERARPRALTKDDMLAQIHALRMDNMRLAEMVEFREDRLLALLVELEAAHMLLRLVSRGLERRPLPSAGV